VPKVFEINGYRFFFCSNEGEPLESAYIHVRKNKVVAKFWLSPDIKLASSWGFRAKELNWLEDIVSREKTRFMEAWNEYFG